MGCRIATPDGEQLIEELRVGDLVRTLDHGPQPIRWICRRTVPGTGKMSPIIVREGTLGATADFAVSPNHRILVAGAVSELILGRDATLVAAKALVNGTTILRQPTGFVTYVHLMFDQHEIIRAAGCYSESLLAGEQSLSGLDRAQRSEIFAVFPELKTSQPGMHIAPARHLAKRHEGRALATLL